MCISRGLRGRRDVGRGFAPVAEDSEGRVYRAALVVMTLRSACSAFPSSGCRALPTDGHH